MCTVSASFETVIVPYHDSPVPRFDSNRFQISKFKFLNFDIVKAIRKFLSKFISHRPGDESWNFICMLLHNFGFSQKIIYIDNQNLAEKMELTILFLQSGTAI
jgi:hypothetical protein